MAAEVKGVLGHSHSRNLCGRRPVFRIADLGMSGPRYAVLDRDGTIMVERQFLSGVDQVELILESRRDYVNCVRWALGWLW